jgi:ABC-2 type transport system permease protein
VAASYRFDLVLRVGRLLISLLMFYFIGRAFSGSVSPYLERYGGDYFPYVLVGIALSSFVTVGLHSLAQEVRSAQVQGTLEALLSTPTSTYMVLVGNSLWSFLTAAATAVLILAVGVLLLGIRVAPLHCLTGAAIVGLTFVAFLTVGMLSAAFTMVFKKGNPIGLLFGTSSYFLGGVLFPVEVLPGPFQRLASLLPITHSIRALRELLLAQAQPEEIIFCLVNLTVFIIVLAPISILAFRYAVRRAKIDGSLVQY